MENFTGSGILVKPRFSAEDAFSLALKAAAAPRQHHSSGPPVAMNGQKAPPPMAHRQHLVVAHLYIDVWGKALTCDVLGYFVPIPDGCDVK